MTRTPAVVLGIIACLTGCSSVRVTGTVTDAANGHGVSPCGITIGPRYVNTDLAGRYSVDARTWWNKMQVTCLGYESQTVSVDFSKSRYPKIDLQMVARSVPERTNGNAKSGTSTK